MHNCKQTRSALIDLALDEMQPPQRQQLMSELKGCAACQEEYFSLRNTLRVSDHALRSAAPAESFWSGYHARLSQHIEKGLENHSSTVQPGRSSGALNWWSGLRKIAAASVRIPVPVAAALILLLACSTFFVWRSRASAKATPAAQAASVEIRTVEVPVIHEKVVTRVVYVEKNRRESRNAASQSAPANNAQAGPEAPGTTAMSLVGFKPTDQVKLKIMKGSYHDEK